MNRYQMMIMIIMKEYKPKKGEVTLYEVVKVSLYVLLLIPAGIIGGMIVGITLGAIVNFINDKG